MKFKFPVLEDELATVHPKVLVTLQELDEWCNANGIPEVVVTHVLRTKDEQQAIYTKYADSLLRKMEEGKPLAESERKLAKTLSDMKPEERVAWARERFSWHLVGCAVDIRNTHYTAKELSAVMSFLRQGRPIGPYEILSHDVASGAHCHIGFRDFSRRKGNVNVQ